MSKSRFSTTDTKAMVRDIRATLLGQRVANIYDLNDKTYLFKFAVPGKSEKVLLLLESGIRFHTTKYARDKSDLPSPFAMKLRKHIRTRRLEDVRQLCNDRIVDFKFGSGDSVFHIILELYANGNIILADGNYEILALLRTHQFEEDVAIRVNEIYPVAFATTMDTALLNRVSTSEATSDVTTGALDTGETTESSSALTMDPAAFVQWAQQRDADSNAWALSAPPSKAAGGGKKNKAKKMTMRQLLLSRDSGVSSYGPEIIDHCLLTAGVKVATKVCDFISDTQALIIAASVLKEIRAAESLLQSLDVPGQRGYVLYNKSLGPAPAPSPIPSSTLPPTGLEPPVSETATSPAQVEIMQFMDFVPRMFLQHEGQSFLEYSSFDEAVDEYYCKVEEQKLERVAVSAEETARKKVDKVKGEQNSLIATLEKQQRKMEEGALLVELFADDVDKCMLVINSALTAGMSWDDIDTMVKAETAKGNAIASLVHRLRLDRNIIVLKLTNLYAEDSEDEDQQEEEAGISSSTGRTNSSKSHSVEVEVDLGMTAYANVSRLYGHKKVAQAKEIKTVQASQRALIAVEHQSAKTLEAQKIKRNLQAVRKVHWFEKFNWFVTSEGYLVLSGRDAQQNEALVKRYLRPGDVYVHAELHGASSCIVRCKTVQSTAQSSSTSNGASAFKPISPFALQEAGNMTVCRSGAWGAKIVTSAWWVFGTQVSKSAPTGEYLPTGSFMIYGKKNFLPPMPLEMGFGVMFRLDDGSVMRHAGDRKDRSSMSDETESVLSEAASRYGIEFEGLGLREVDTDDEDEGSEAGDADSERDSEGEEEEEADPAEAGIAAISISAFQLTPIPESDPDQDIDTDEGGDARPAPSSNSGGVDAVARGGAGRLTAKERRLLKAAKAKGGEAKVTAPARAVKKESASNEGTSANHHLEQDDQDLDSEGGDEENEDENESEEERERERERARMTKSDPKNAKGSATSTSKKGGNNNKGTSQRGGTQGSGSEPVKTPLVGPPPSATNKKKFVNKKKAKRYADQDDDEKELAMLALGHVHVGEVYGEKEEILKKEKEQKDRAHRQEKAGIKIVKDVWSDLMALLSVQVRAEVEGMVSRGVLKEGEIDGHEIKTLATFSEKDGISVLDLFKDGDNLSKVGNKSGFLAGIMRRFSKDALAAGAGGNSVKALSSGAKGSSNSSSSSNTGAIEDEELGVEADMLVGDGVEGTEEHAMSRRERKKKEQQEIQSILEEEGVLDEEEGKQADEINKLTGKPLPEDVLLYAVPVCGPYSAIRSFKYSVKLTPGTMKKGKAAKQAIDVFTRGRECSAVEKALMRSLNDPEMVAIMIGDIKLSMPGLYQVQRAKKGKK